MYIVWGIFLAFAVFTVVVFFHELGHFLAARWAKVKVEEFGIGIPPKAKDLFTDRHGTKFTLNYVPLGGFVRLKGESEDSPDGKDKDSFIRKGYFAKSVVLLAGVAFNFVFAWIVISALFIVGVAPLGINEKFPTETKTLLIPSFDQARETGLLKTDGIELDPLPGSAAEASGIRSGDRIVSIGGYDVSTPEYFVEYVKQHPAEETALVIDRSGAILTISVTPRDGKLGIRIGYRITGIDDQFRYRFSPPEAIIEWAKETYRQGALTFELLGILVRKLAVPATPTDRQEARESLSGPIAIGNLFVSLSSASVPASVILLIMAMISINLGVFNLLPLPALDGGRWAFLTIERTLRSVSRGRLKGDRLEGRVHAVGFALLILLSILIAYQDILRIIHQ